MSANTNTTYDHRRALIQEPALHVLHTQRLLGVPLTRLAHKVGLSTPTVTKLLRHYDVYVTSPTPSIPIYRSLFPSWLRSPEYADTLEYWAQAVQRAPHTSVYTGFFPLGRWQE
jgi:hypothetical protein